MSQPYQFLGFKEVTYIMPIQSKLVDPWATPSGFSYICNLCLIQCISATRGSFGPTWHLYIRCLYDQLMIYQVKMTIIYGKIGPFGLYRISSGELCNAQKVNLTFHYRVPCRKPKHLYKGTILVSHIGPRNHQVQPTVQCDTHKVQSLYGQPRLNKAKSDLIWAKQGILSLIYTIQAL